MKKIILFITLSLSMFCLTVYAEDSTFTKVEEIETLTITHENNYAMIKKGNTYIAIWTKVELTEEQKQTLLDFLKENDKSIKKQTALYAYGYGTHSFEGIGELNFEFTNDGIVISSPTEAVSHINYGKFADVKVGDLIIKVNDTTDNNNDETFTFTITADQNIADGKYGDVLFVNGTTDIIVKPNTQVNILNLPSGINYTIYDKETEKILLKYENKEGVIPSNGLILAEFTYGENTTSEEPEEPKEPEEEKEEKPAEQEPESEKNPNTKDIRTIALIFMLVVSTSFIILRKYIKPQKNIT